MEVPQFRLITVLGGTDVNVTMHQSEGKLSEMKTVLGMSAGVVSLGKAMSAHVEKLIEPTAGKLTEIPQGVDIPPPMPGW